MYESELFRLSEYVVLVAVGVMVVVDMLFDLRRAPAVDRVVTVGLRQTAIRLLFWVRTLVLSRRFLGVWVLPAFTLLDIVLMMLGL